MSAPPFSALLFACSLVLLSLAPPATAQDASLPHAEQAGIVLDGIPDEPAWENARSFTEWHQLTPNEGEPASEETTLFLFHDDRALYLAAHVYESDPAEIVSRTLERNTYHRSKQDGLGIILDTNNDDRTAFGFIITSAGARTDVAIFDEVRVRWNADWNAFWDAATARHDEGWTAELRIPFSSLRFQPDDRGDVEMGLLLWRYLARNDEMLVYPSIPNNWSNSAYKPSQTEQITFHGIEPQNPLYIKPYVLGGLAQQHHLNEIGDAYVTDNQPDFDVGLDLKYNVTSNLVLDVTANTDFAQVEADDERFNLDRFSLYFPEKRDFFQERSDLFNFRLPGGADRIFQSRRIGIIEGQPVSIYGGARLSGRHGGWELGLLNMQTAPATVSGEDVPSENFGVLRVQRPVLDAGSYVGGMFTSRTDFRSQYNVVYAFDADLHLGRSTYLGLQLGQSVEPESDPLKSLVSTFILQRRIGRGLSFGSSYTYVGQSFHPAAGFVRRVGLNRWGHRTQYTWFPSTRSFIQNHSLAHRFEFIWNHRFERLETNTSSLTWNFSFRSNAAAQAQIAYADERLAEGFSVGDLSIGPGHYRFVDGSIRFDSPSGRSLQLGMELSGGGYFSGSRLGGTLDVTWNPSPHLSLSMDNIYNRIDLPAGEYDVVINRLRLGTALNRELSGSAYVQYNSSARVITPNVRIRYNPQEGSDLYLVYNEGINTVRTPAAGPLLPYSQHRSVQIKYTYTFVN